RPGSRRFIQYYQQGSGEGASIGSAPAGAINRWFQNNSDLPQGRARRLPADLLHDAAERREILDAFPFAKRLAAGGAGHRFPAHHFVRPGGFQVGSSDRLDAWRGVAAMAIRSLNPVIRTTLTVAASAGR